VCLCASPPSVKEGQKCAQTRCLLLLRAPPYTVTVVLQVIMMMGSSRLESLDVTEVAGRLLAGWACIRHYFECGPDVTVVHKPAIITTRSVYGEVPDGVELLDRDKV
jgi:hypothetical protein